MEGMAPDSSRTLSILYMELKGDLKVLNERLNGWENLFSSKLDKIIDQTTKTNGRVTKLEDWHSSVCNDIKDIIEERKNNIKDNKVRIKDLIWSLLKQGLTVLLTALTTVMAMFWGMKGF